MTAVEWLYEELSNNFFDIQKSKEILEKAKQMEKQQKIDFATDFARDYIGFSSVCTDANDLGPAAYYYNQINK